MKRKFNLRERERERVKIEFIIINDNIWEYMIIRANH